MIPGKEARFKIFRTSVILPERVNVDGLLLLKVINQALDIIGIICLADLILKTHGNNTALLETQLSKELVLRNHPHITPPGL